jgi:hypothetical protein
MTTITMNILSTTMNTQLFTMSQSTTNQYTMMCQLTTKLQRRLNPSQHLRRKQRRPKLRMMLMHTFNPFGIKKLTTPAGRRHMAVESESTRAHAQPVK